MDDLVDPDRFFDLFLDDARPGDHARRVGGPVTRWHHWWRSHLPGDPMVTAAARHGFVLSVSELAAFGVTRARMRTYNRRGQWTPAGRGAVAPIDLRRDLPDVGGAALLARRRHAVCSVAAVKRRPDDAVSGRSGAVLHGLPTLAVPIAPELTARGSVGLGPGGPAHLYGATLDAHELTDWFGVEVSAVARTLVDLARRDPRDAVMAADAALRERIVSVEQIEAALTLAIGWPGIKQARDVLAIADALAESPLESLVRLRLHRDRFPPPRLQAVIGPDRVDFYWPEYRLVLEADGRAKYTDDELWREKKREQRLRSCGNRVERVVWADVLGGWADTRSLLRAAMR